MADDVFVQISESQTGRALRTHRWKYSVRCPDTDANGRLVSQAGANTYVEDCLYDLRADPWELTNLIGGPAYAAITADLRKRLLKRMTAVGEKKPRVLPAPPAAMTHQRKVEQFPLD